MSDAVRKLLFNLIEQAGLDMANLSREMGRGESYLSQYFRKGSPKNLSEQNRRFLADKLGVHESSLRTGELIKKAPKKEKRVNDGIVLIPHLEFKPGMGGGGIPIDEEPTDTVPWRQEDLKGIRLDTADLISVYVDGDSMSPTLESGDRVLINKNDRNPVRGGIFAVNLLDTLVVKRVNIDDPGAEPLMLQIKSDNPLESDYKHPANDTMIIGRIVWYARRI